MKENKLDPSIYIELKITNSNRMVLNIKEEKICMRNLTQSDLCNGPKLKLAMCKMNTMRHFKSCMDLPRRLKYLNSFGGHVTLAASYLKLSV